MATGRGANIRSIPRSLGVFWTFPFKFRSIEPVPAIFKLSTSRGSITLKTPHPEGIHRTDPWRMRVVLGNTVWAKILDRISVSRRWGLNSWQLFDSTDYTRLPIYIDVVWDPEEIVDINYESEKVIDLEVA